MFNPADDSEHVTIVEAAEWIGTSPRTLDRWALAGRIRSFVTAEGQRIFSRRELIERSVRMPRY